MPIFSALRIGIDVEAGWTRLELATSCVTGRRSNQTELPPQIVNGEKTSGPERDRTADLLNAIQALSQLSYRPLLTGKDGKNTGGG